MIRYILVKICDFFKIKKNINKYYNLYEYIFIIIISSFFYEFMYYLCLEILGFLFFILFIPYITICCIFFFFVFYFVYKLYILNLNF